MAPRLKLALQQQLGLKLEPQTAPVEMLVIDHVEKPSENNSGRGGASVTSSSACISLASGNSTSHFA